jgi:hypothetical protein
MNEFNNKIGRVIYINIWNTSGNIQFKNVNSFIIINSPSNNMVINRLLDLDNNNIIIINRRLDLKNIR